MFTKLTLKNLKLNKSRTIGTILGIILSVSLICAVCSIAVSFRTSIIKETIQDAGYYHIKLMNIDNNKYEEIKLNKDVNKTYLMYIRGYSKIDLSKKEENIMKIYSTNIDTFNDLSYEIIEGEFPKNENEILINKRTSIFNEYEVGNYINIDVSDKIQQDGSEKIIQKTYKIVGIYEKNSDESIVITTNETSNNMDVYIALKKPSDYKKSFMELLEIDNYNVILNQTGIKYDFSINEELLKWEVVTINESSTKTIIRIASVIISIIIVTSVYCIKNSFSISTTEKMKMYGMLSSIGATKKQIKKIVINEGMILGLIGIPLGIIIGNIAVLLLIKIVNVLIGETIIKLEYEISTISIIVSIILGIITIYLSTISSAKKASKVSPIENLRNNTEIKSNKIKTPKMIKKIFKTGGVIAYKNLKRSKRKYRTTIISLTISIFTFISLYTFVNKLYEETISCYKQYDYNLEIVFMNENEQKIIEDIKKMNNIDNIYITYNALTNIEIRDKNKINKYENNTCTYEQNNNEICSGLNVVLLEDETFKKYIKKINGNYNHLKDKGILFNEKTDFDMKEKKYKKEKIYNYKEGNIIDSKLTTEATNIKVEIGKITNISAYGSENTEFETGYIILNKKYFNNINKYVTAIHIKTDNTIELAKKIKEYNDEIAVVDYDEMVKTENARIIVISVFLYGFIGIITLIGLTNIFNTITSNMELRKKEFAMLKSIGMTNKEFKRMIILETIFYCSKSLIYGIILGTIGSYIIYKGFNSTYDSSFNMPYKAIIVSIISVFIVIYIIMQYSMKKINKKNIIETIRNDNI